MWLPLCAALLFVISVYLTTGESPRWDLMHQDTYEVEIHHIEVPWINSSYGKIESLGMVRFNRSHPRVLNFSINLYKEVGDNLELKIQLYKLLSNRYKFFPLTATIQACQEYKKNSFGAKDLIAKFTNLNPCPQKPGHLYGIHVYADYSRLPPLIPYGDYKMSVDAHQDNDKLADIDVFASITAKAKARYEH